MSDLTLTQRELDEIELAMYYASRLNHGTAGHNRLLLIAKLARAMKDIEDNLGQVVMDGLAGAVNRAGNTNAGLRQDANGVTVEKPSGVAEVEISGQKHGVTLTSEGPYFSGNTPEHKLHITEAKPSESELGKSIDSRLGDEPISPSDRVAEIALVNPLVDWALAVYREGKVTYTEALEAALLALHDFVDTQGRAVSRDSEGRLILTVPGRSLRQDENGVTTLDGVPIVPSMTEDE